MRLIKNFLNNKEEIWWHIKMIWKNYINISDKPIVYSDRLAISGSEMNQSLIDPSRLVAEQLDDSYQKTKLKLGSYMREVGRAEHFRKDEPWNESTVVGWKAYFIPLGERAK